MRNTLSVDTDKEILQEIFLMKEITSALAESRTLEGVTKTSSGWYSISNPKIIDYFFHTMGDQLSREIFLALSKSPQPASKILESIKCPKTSLYRKLNELVDTGFLNIRNYQIRFGKKFAIYESNIEEIRLDMGEHMKFYIKFKEQK